ncbi:hypothetical protein RB195_026255 [Necator americanus]|uniref:Uncharacterized protein n=1 Tax=Necator americanus TaxID=51031 RepID=A0ABR1EWA4_NECAM
MMLHRINRQRIPHWIFAANITQPKPNTRGTLLFSPVDGMLSARVVLALLYMLMITVAIATAAPNRILMRFGKRTADPMHFRPMAPADYYPQELFGSSHAVDGDM